VSESGVHGTFIAPRATYWVHPVCFAFDVNGRLGLRTDAKGQLNPAQLGVPVQGQPAVVGAFPPHKFLVGIHKAKSGTALGGSLLRPLAWWWCAANFSADWLLNLAQIFGLPFRWANYDPTAPQETVDRICSMLQNMGSAGWAAFPAGTTMELKEAGDGGDHSPQGELLDRADRYARLLILGQTMSGSQDASKGGGKAFGSVESDVKAKRIEAAGRYVCRVLNTQLIPSILTLNYGEADEAPKVRMLEDEEGSLEEAQRDETLAGAGLKIGVDFLRKKYGIPAPGKDEETIGGAPATEEGVTRGPGDKGTDPELAAHAARLNAITDEAVFARELRALAGLVCINDPEGQWVTIRGRHVLVHSGETAMEALTRHQGEDRDDPQPKSEPSQVSRLTPSGKSVSLQVKHDGEAWRVEVEGTTDAHKFASRAAASAYAKETLDRIAKQSPHMQPAQ
jgi:hypothetical protein